MDVSVGVVLGMLRTGLKNLDLVAIVLDLSEKVIRDEREDWIATIATACTNGGARVLFGRDVSS